MTEAIKRSKILAFYGVPQKSDSTVTYTFHRMKGFDSISTSKNPKEYSRQYVDEEFEQTDVVGYTPTVSFEFDRFAGDPVHDDIIAIFNGEKTGADATRPVIMVDMTGTTKSAIKRDFAIFAESEGEGTEMYTYSGSMRVKGDKVFGTATSLDDWQTCTFTETSE